MAETSSDAASVVAFWRKAGPDRWFAKDEVFDADFRSKFLELHEQAAAGKLESWLATPEGALGLILLLDQFPRNCFRGTTQVYETDPLSRRMARRALDAGFDLQVEPALRLFFYLPFAHSEDLADQEISLSKGKALGEPYLKHAQGHYDIVKQFGRFPHRNVIFGRQTTDEEQAFLEAGGFAG
jgi:uncharacterized protein (DUF924 family)